MSVVDVVCCQVEVSASGQSLEQWSPTECGVSEYHRKASILRRPTGGCYAMVKKKKCDYYCWLRTGVWLVVVGFVLLRGGGGGGGCRYRTECSMFRL